MPLYISGVTSHSISCSLTVEETRAEKIIKMMTSKIAHQLASLLKQRLCTFNRKKRRMVVSEEEMDNIANEALEAVLGCT